MGLRPVAVFEVKLAHLRREQDVGKRLFVAIGVGIFRNRLETAVFNRIAVIGRKSKEVDFYKKFAII